jgi:hypothetical protein
MKGGEVVSNVQWSEGYAYGSAVVDPVTGLVWVFGSPADLCNRSRSHDKPVYVRAWWSEDMVEWHTATHPALGPDILTSYPFNTDVCAVNSSTHALAKVGLPTDLNFVMVLESGRVALHTGPSRNLSTGWTAVHGKMVSSTSGFGACPSIHYAVETGHFYVISGACTALHVAI